MWSGSGSGGMKKLRRTLANTSAMISFLLCFALLIAWGPSYSCRDDFICVHFGESRFFSIRFFDGEVGINVGREKRPMHEIESSGPVFVYWYSNRLIALPRWASNDGEFRSQAGLWVPIWIAVAALAVWPFILATIRGKALRREQRIKAGLCWSCGFDVRATPDRCSECGAAQSETP
jgi:hypothetical protein